MPDSWFLGFFDGSIFYLDFPRIIGHGRDLSLLFLLRDLVLFFDDQVKFVGALANLTWPSLVEANSLSPFSSMSCISLLAVRRE